MIHQGKLNYHRYIRKLNFIAFIKELFSFLDPYAEIEANKLSSFAENVDNENSTSKIQDALIRAEFEKEEPVTEEEW
jgi:hypothetical protein